MWKHAKLLRHWYGLLGYLIQIPSYIGWNIVAKQQSYSSNHIHTEAESTKFVRIKQK